MNEKLKALITEMEIELKSCADDYSQTKDRWAMGGMYQLSVFIPKLREINNSNEVKPLTFQDKLQRDLGEG